MVFESHSAEDTEKIGCELAKKALPGDIYCLSGELGAGKTVFAKGFAKGLGITARVTSPTFTILNEYGGGKVNLYHFDLYRLESPEELVGIGFEEYLFGEGVTLIEWPEKAGNLLPAHAVHIKIETSFIENPDYRRFTVERGGIVG